MILPEADSKVGEEDDKIAGVRKPLANYAVINNFL
jgi:hypothetical protein